MLQSVDSPFKKFSLKLQNHPTSIFHTRIEDCVEIEQKPRSEHALTADGGTLPFLEQKENPMHLNHMHYHNVT
jgi:hypothetical protein